MARFPVPSTAGHMYREGIWRSDVVAQSLLAVPCTVSTAVRPGLTLCSTRTRSLGHRASALMSWLVSIKVYGMRISTSSYPTVPDAWRIGTRVLFVDVPGTCQLDAHDLPDGHVHFTATLTFISTTTLSPSAHLHLPSVLPSWCRLWNTRLRLSLTLRGVDCHQRGTCCAKAAYNGTALLQCARDYTVTCAYARTSTRHSVQYVRAEKRLRASCNELFNPLPPPPQKKKVRAFVCRPIQSVAVTRRVFQGWALASDP